MGKRSLNEFKLIFLRCFWLPAGFDEIWLIIEKEMKTEIPPYMKHVLKYCGYEDYNTIATIEEGDIDYFVNDVRGGSVINFYDGKISAEDVMKGSTTSIKNFVIRRGHQAIAKTAKFLLEVNGVNQIKDKIKRKNEIQQSTSAPRKRIKYLRPTSTLVQDINWNQDLGINEEPGDVSLTSVKKARSTLIRKAVLSLITHTPEMFADNFERMITDNEPMDVIRVEVDLLNEYAYICCPLCSNPIRVSLSFNERWNEPWWNTSNFDRHVKIHQSYLNLETEDDSENVLPSMNFATNRPMPLLEDKGCSSLAISNVTEQRNNSCGISGIMLQNFVNLAKRNMERKKNGYRFDLLSKMFGSYIFMVAGTLAYETINANFPLSVPSVSTVHRFLADNGPQVIEGAMRTAELLVYLKSRNLPLWVSLSEDATRITAKISYDPKTNQLIGYALPLDKNGMPLYKFYLQLKNESRKTK